MVATRPAVYRTHRCRVNESAKEGVLMRPLPIITALEPPFVACAILPHNTRQVQQIPRHQRWDTRNGGIVRRSTCRVVGDSCSIVAGVVVAVKGNRALVG